LNPKKRKIGEISNS
jgi:hypothetical protein